MWFPHIHRLNQPHITQRYNTAGKNLHISRPMQFKLVLFKGQLTFIVPLSTCGPNPCILLLHVFNFHGEKSKNVSCSVMSNSLRPHGLQLARLLCSWNSPGKNTGVDSHSLLQGIIPTQGSNPGLRHSRPLLTVWATREISYCNLHTTAILHTTLLFCLK